MSNGYGRSTEGFGVDRDASIDLIVKAAIDNGVEDPRHIAYMLATAEHETRDFTAPEEDYGRSQARKLGYSGGENYYGRGYVHLTHDYNYRQFDELLGMDGELVRNPHRATDPEIAAKILVIGMRDGLFTGRRLDQYINEDTQDYYNARRVVNGISTRHPWSLKAADECVQFADEWERRMPELVERAKQGVIQEPLDPVHALEQTIAKLTGIQARDDGMTDGMPNFLLVPGKSPDQALTDGTLRLGERGPAVRDLQQRLNTLGLTDGHGRKLGEDGVFGRNTREAVESFQLWEGLATNGIADGNTLRMIESQHARSLRSQASTAVPEEQTRLNDAVQLGAGQQRTLADNPAHPDFGTFDRIHEWVRGTGQWDEDKSRNVACALYREQTADPLMLRVDKVAGAVGRDGAENVFAVYAPYGDAGPFFHARVDGREACTQPAQQNLEQAEQIKQQQVEQQQRLQQENIEQPARNPQLSF